MDSTSYYACVIIAYIAFAFLGLLINYFNTDIIYLLSIIFVGVGCTSIVVDKIISDKNNNKPFYHNIYKDKSYMILSILNYLRLLLLIIALSFKDLGAVNATYLTFPIFVIILGIPILKYIPTKDEILGVVLAFIGILIINFNSLRRVITGKFTKIILYTFLFPLIASIVISYIILLSKKYSHLTANQYIEAIFVPVIPITIFICLLRNLPIFKKIFNYICVPHIKPNIFKFFMVLLYAILIFYPSNLIIYLFVKKYTAILASILSYVAIFMSFIIKKYYFKKKIKYHKIFGSFFVLGGIIIISYATHKIRHLK